MPPRAKAPPISSLPPPPPVVTIPVTGNQMVSAEDIAAYISPRDVAAYIPAPPPTTELEEARRILYQNRIEKLPLVVVIGNNQFAYSTPNSRQFACADLVEKARGYGIGGFFGNLVGGYLAERSERPVMWLVPHFMALDVAGADVLQVAPTTLPGGTSGTAYDQTLTATGGVGPYTYAMTGSLPSGVSLVGNTVSGSGNTGIRISRATASRTQAANQVLRNAPQATRHQVEDAVDVLAAKASLEQAQLQAAKLKAHFAAHSLSWQGTEFNASLSIGVAHSKEVNCNVEALLMLADKRMYQQKSAQHDFAI